METLRIFQKQILSTNGSILRTHQNTSSIGPQKRPLISQRISAWSSSSIREPGGFWMETIRNMYAYLYTVRGVYEPPEPGCLVYKSLEIRSSSRHGGWPSDRAFGPKHDPTGTQKQMPGKTCVGRSSFSSGCRFFFSPPAWISSQDGHPLHGPGTFIYHGTAMYCPLHGPEDS